VLGPDINRSWFDCTIEPWDAAEHDVVEFAGAAWRQGRGPIDDPLRPAVAVRLGLRYVRNMGEAEISRVEAARIIGGEFASPEDLAVRTGLSIGCYEGLAAADALRSLGLDRRGGMWAAGAMAEIDQSRLALSPGLLPPPLAPMTKLEDHQADLWSTGVSTAHPIGFIRDRLRGLGCLTIAEVLEIRRNGRRAGVGGVVTHRQRPGTANGVIFFNLEDETGLLNVVVLPEVWAEQKQLARRQPGLVITGVVEYRDGVTNLVAHRFEPLPVSPFPISGVKSRDFR